MEFFKKTNIDFLGIKSITNIISIILCVLSITSLAMKGINFDLDFTGGYSIQVTFPNTISPDSIHKKLDKAGFGHSQVINFGSAKRLKIDMMPKKYMQTNTIKSSEQKTKQDMLRKDIQDVIGPEASIDSINFIGPEVGKELTQKGILAIFIAVLATMVYIAVRFDMKFAISSAIALAHDPIIILGIFSVFQFSFDLTTLAAILAVIGYSLNDTVVVYDRVRENFRSMRTASVTEVINRAINDTLSRTVITSGLTLVVVIVLFVYGGPSIHYFSLALIIGIIVGTYSSIYVAGSLAVVLGLTRESLLPPQRVDNTP